MKLDIAFDASESIRGSIHDVEFTLILTVCLVVMVIFLFLRNLSATLIPGAAVPLSIIGTFAAMYLLGYSLNNLSLMALTLSVGFVVDDAIVMLENIVRYMEMGKSAHGSGAAGLARDRLHHPLDDHLAGGGVHPGAVHGRHRGPAAARVLGDHHGGHSDFRLRLAELDAHAGQPLPAVSAATRGTAWSTASLESGFNGLARAYDVTLRGVLRHQFVTLLVAVALLVGTVYLFFAMPTGFIPSQDSSFMFGVTLAGQDISFESMAKHHMAVADIVMSGPQRAATAARLWARATRASSS